MAMHNKGILPLVVECETNFIALMNKNQWSEIFFGNYFDSLSWYKIITQLAFVQTDLINGKGLARSGIISYLYKL